MKLFRLLFFLLILTVNFLWASSLPVQLLSERHRTEWNWVEYRLKLKNISNKPLKNPVIRYFAENPRIQYCRANPNDAGCSGTLYGNYQVDSTLRAVVDYFSVVNSVKPKYYYDSKHTVITLRFQGTIPAGASSKVHLRIMKKNYPAWDCTRDYSFQKNALIQEEHYKMAVYDADGNILWGNDPVSLKHDTAHVYWHDRSSISVISPYQAKDSSKTLNGRFWVLKGNSLSPEELDSLSQMGVDHLEMTRYQNKGLHLLKVQAPISKQSLNRILSNFYNAFAVDDTTQLSTSIFPGDIYVETKTCDENDSCTTVITERPKLDIVVGCWPDLIMSTCKSVVSSCGGDSVYADFSVVLGKVHKDSIQCIEKHKDVRYVKIQREEKLDNNNGRHAINLTTIQEKSNNPYWNNALQALQVTEGWLQGVDYTGDGVVVGVYDDPIDFNHPAFNELDANGENVPRKASGFNDTRTSFEDGHGTHVAGIIGGNGRTPQNFNGIAPYLYRGVAPKVKYLSGKKEVYNQRGHVTNHSHGIIEGIVNLGEQYYQFYYGTSNSELDEKIFFDWKPHKNGKNTDNGDNITKTIVFSAGNAGNGFQYSTQRGYYSLSKDSKNVITVGSINSYDLSLSDFSSLGPTWDGRIKPDIMAPGYGGAVSRFGVDKPFVAYIDYIRINEMEVNFDNNPYMINKDMFIPGCPITEEEKRTTFRCRYLREPPEIAPEYITDFKASNNRALKLTLKNLSAKDININWDYRAFRDTPFQVKKGDVITIRLKIPEYIRNEFSVMTGRIWMASGDDFYEKQIPQKFVDFLWVPNAIEDEYDEISFEWTETNVASKFLRIDINFDMKGILSTIPCNMEKDNFCYGVMLGTSMSAPFVSGVAALMYQNYHKKTGDYSMRNSTTKALLIHSAIDMLGCANTNVDIENVHKKQPQPQLCTPYTLGPDFATGWGRVDAKGALTLMNGYDSKSNSFANFREFELYEGSHNQKSWNIFVPRNQRKLRTTLVWDDAPANSSIEEYMQPKLINDLDVYLVSPSSKIFYPWRLNPLPLKNMNDNGDELDIEKDNLKDREWGLEKITFDDANTSADKNCRTYEIVDDECFDRRNNVEVVDVDNPEPGVWQIVAKGYKVGAGSGNSPDGNAQIASIVSDFELMGMVYGENSPHPYTPNAKITGIVDLGDALEHYVTFSSQTSLGNGDHISLYDEFGQLIGTYTGNSLANKKVTVKTRFLKIIIDSDDDNSQGFGYSISKVEHLSYGVLQVLFPPYKKKE